VYFSKSEDILFNLHDASLSTLISANTERSLSSELRYDEICNQN
jgi:hypothetical protein